MVAQGLPGHTWAFSTLVAWGLLPGCSLVASLLKWLLLLQSVGSRALASVVAVRMFSCPLGMKNLLRF